MYPLFERLTHIIGSRKTTFRRTFVVICLIHYVWCGDLQLFDHLAIMSQITRLKFHIIIPLFEQPFVRPISLTARNGRTNGGAQHKDDDPPSNWQAVAPGTALTSVCHAR